MVYIDGEERDTSPVRPLWRDYKPGVRTVIGREEGVATYRLGLRRVPVDELGLTWFLGYGLLHLHWAIEIVWIEF